MRRFRRLSGWVLRQFTTPPAAERPTDTYADVEIDAPEKDRFGFRDYARVLERRARQAEPPFTIGIFGRWGSGKTSLMRLMESILEAEPRLPPVETISVDRNG